MDKALEFLVDHGGFGTIFGLMTGWLAIVLWRRNNDLQDSRAQLAKEIERQAVELNEIRGFLERAIIQAASDRRELIELLKKRE